jgi:hypothetical protein
MDSAALLLPSEEDSHDFFFSHSVHRLGKVNAAGRLRCIFLYENVGTLFNIACICYNVTLSPRSRCGNLFIARGPFCATEYDVRAAMRTGKYDRLACLYY